MAKPPRKFAFEETVTGHPPHENAVIAEAVKQCRHLLAQNWHEVKAEREASDLNTVTVSLTLQFVHAAKMPVVKAKITVRKKNPCDEMDGIVDDPSQTTLPIEGGAS